MVVSGGENLYPTEIENVIREHPNVFDTAVYGIPDAGLGEILAVSVIPKPGTELTADDIKDYCVNAGMRKNYIPRPAFIEIMDSFPMTASGKVQKFKLKEAAIVKYGREDLLKRKTA